MPDRTIPFYNVILRCDSVPSLPAALPEGYSFRMYRSGDAKDWAALEHAIGDFASAEEAEQYFRSTYLVAEPDIRERCVFAVDPQGRAVGSCIAWRDPKGDAQVASLHWLVVSPERQGLGIGKTLCRETMRIFRRMGEEPVYIHTQPWSYPAILLYVRQGFHVLRTDTFSHYENQYGPALRVLREILPPAQFREIAASTI